MKRKIKLAVVGSQSLVYTKNRVYFEINEIRKIYDVIEIVSGGAKGIDAHGKQYAQDHSLRYKEYPAKWQDFSEPCIKRSNQYGDYNALAGINRNTLIADYCDKGLVIWDGKSPGTADVYKKIVLLDKLFKKITIHS